MKFSIRKTFVTLSFLFITFMVLFYGSRLVYYYKLEHKKTSSSVTLKDKIASSENLLKNKDTMKKEKKTIYYYGQNPDNYIYYSGLLYRILYIKGDSIYAITDEEVTKLKYGTSSSFKKSYISKWLNKTDENTGIFINNLENSNIYLKDEEVTLLDKETYLKIGANDSFVVDDDFWVLDNDKALVLTEEGELSKTSNYSDFLGVKPVIKIKADNKYISGDGTKEKPYTFINRTVSSLQNLYVGDYVKYNTLYLRVIEKDDDSVKFVTTTPLENKHNFSYNSNVYRTTYSYYDLGYYLNNTFINKMYGSDVLQKTFYIGEYNLDYKETLDKSIDTKIGLLKIGDYFIGDIKNSFILTTNNEFIYKIDEDGNLMSESILSELDIYPSFSLTNTLNIKEGTGTKDNPFIVGD